MKLDLCTHRKVSAATSKALLSFCTANADFLKVDSDRLKV